METFIADSVENIHQNVRLWNDAEAWKSRHSYGFQWGGGKQQSSTGISMWADKFLRPVIFEHFSKQSSSCNPYSLRILEIAPGAGRFTAELIRYACSIDLIDLNQTCLDICAERFKYYPLQIGYYCNDGQSCEQLSGKQYDLIASFDSMVHVHHEILANYFASWAKLLAPNGILFIDHSGRGAKKEGFRTNVTAELAASWVLQNNLVLLAQPFRNNHDCVTIAQKKKE